MDSQNKKGNFFIPYLWLAAALFFPVIAIPAYFILKIVKPTTQITNKENGKTILCPKCGKENNLLQSVCCFCNNQLNI